MERLNNHVSTLLVSSALAVGIVSGGAYSILGSFEEIFREFNTQLPLILSWVFPSYRFWWLTAFILLVMFVFSLKPKLNKSPAFNKLFYRASIIGFCTSVLFIVFSVASIYWPVMQNA
jgi:type II secretory pathway component PulF